MQAWASTKAEGPICLMGTCAWERVAPVGDALVHRQRPSNWQEIAQPSLRGTPTPTRTFPTRVRISPGLSRLTGLSAENLGETSEVVRETANEETS